MTQPPTEADFRHKINTSYLLKSLKRTKSSFLPAVLADSRSPDSMYARKSTPDMRIR